MLSALAFVLVTAVQAAVPSDCELQPARAVTWEIDFEENCSRYKVADAYLNRSDLTDEEYASWQILNSWIKDGQRGMFFPAYSSSCQYASPGEDKVLSEIIRSGETWSNGTSMEWTYLSTWCPGEVVQGGCFPEECTKSRDMWGLGLESLFRYFPVAGSLLYYELSLCVTYQWDAGETITELHDASGNKYVMFETSTEEAAASGTPAVAPNLPDGWVSASRVLNESFTLTPSPESSNGKPVTFGEKVAFGEYACGMAVILDDGGSKYYRYEMSTNGSADIQLQINLIQKGLAPGTLDNYFFYIVGGIGAACFLAIICGCAVCYKFKICCWNTGPKPDNNQA
mmetsp:Transcript_59442/g.105729  ORF Transcript_59442/g.105729 Transcript_59442/m.105729 type:complete len:341 (+) Transcript_59442:47-1069(+)|eukprot:CAMPEP_0197654922 /NCGR_PEP_ID=MMETSP1338-20131121/39138_1 /TAXON_ID=43686 ORGANISM="Pelagodinium beii, Strain RCC1491" /NCGR_SAMPLE_ID=MMETSP1338 /ASSEMBLY_ACC=CAM_ASM_000754 /LENGTH=340 /DNA_ID=CAMNT_0043230457 /DNA_START=47 /DNA_END=1069 /DNA_ORIENTATION=-